MFVGRTLVPEGAEYKGSLNETAEEVNNQLHLTHYGSL